MPAGNAAAGTTVGDVEHAAGLTRRGGDFYRHFPSNDGTDERLVESRVHYCHDRMTGTST